jgi:hypothetical protein
MPNHESFSLRTSPVSGTSRETTRVCLEGETVFEFQRVATGRFGKYGLPNAGTCNNSNFVDLPEIH